MQHTNLLEPDEEFLKQSEQTQTFFQEYHLIVEDLKKDINECKNEQSRLRNELDGIRNESKIATEAAQECFSQIQDNKCPIHTETENVIITNLEKRLSVMQMEKDSIFQLWQMSLKAIDVLEEELKSCQQDNVNVKLYEDQISTIKESYSIAIKELESKLVQSKEHFLMHENLFESSKTKINELTKEKDQLSQKVKDYERDLMKKEEMYNKTISETMEKLKTREEEVESLNKSKTELQEKFNEAQRLFANIVAKENETMSKVSEALELVETSIREKEEALRRESQAVAEASQLNLKLNAVDKEYLEKLNSEIIKVKELYDSNLKKYLQEIDELKMEIQQKVALTDGIQRECRICQDELDKVRQNAVNFTQKSEIKIVTLEQKLKEKESKLQSCEEMWKLKYNEKCRIVSQYEKFLNDRLHESSNELQKLSVREPIGVESLVKEMNERTKEAAQKYFEIERNLTKSLYEKDKIEAELRSLQMSFERETSRRDHEKKLMDIKIMDLQEALRIATSDGNDGCRFIDGHCHLLKNQWKNCRDELTDNKNSYKLGIDVQLKHLQETSETKIKELTSHVETHQKLNRRWKEEVKSLTEKFKKYSKEMRSKLYALRQENEKLNRELFACRQKLAQYTRYDTVYS